jgi:outer membrane lipoprotein-sorting protein
VSVNSLIRKAFNLLGLLVALSLTLADIWGQGPVPLAEILRHIDRGASEFQSLTADVERTKVTVVVDDHATESGQVRIRRDSKMRIDVTSPDSRTILRNGDRLFIYTPRTRRVEEYDLGEHRALLDQFLLLGFGTSANNLRSNYLITLGAEETLGSQRVVRLELIPKADDVRKEISRIELWLDQATWLPAQQKFHETGSGDYFVIRYTNVARNLSIADSRFRPNWPSGVTRVKPQS